MVITSFTKGKFSSNHAKCFKFMPLINLTILFYIHNNIRFSLNTYCTAGYGISVHEMCWLEPYNNQNKITPISYNQQIWHLPNQPAMQYHSLILNLTLNTLTLPPICLCCSTVRTDSIRRRSIIIRRWDSRNWSLAICQVCLKSSWDFFSSSRILQTMKRGTLSYKNTQVISCHLFLMWLSYSILNLRKENHR